MGKRTEKDRAMAAELRSSGIYHGRRMGPGTCAPAVPVTAADAIEGDALMAERKHPLWRVFRGDDRLPRLVEAPDADRAAKKVRGATRVALVGDKINRRLFPALFADEPVAGSRARKGRAHAA